MLHFRDLYQYLDFVLLYISYTVFVLFKISSLYVAAVCTPVSSFFSPFIFKRLSVLGRCNFYTIDSFHLIFRFITIIIMSSTPFTSTIGSLIFKILQIKSVNLFVNLNTVYFLCKSSAVLWCY